jgi:hypothetical protein
MGWSAEKTDKFIFRGQLVVRVKFSNPDLPDDAAFVEEYRDSELRDDWPDSIIRSRLQALESINLDKIELGLPTARPVEIAADTAPKVG